MPKQWPSSAMTTRQSLPFREMLPSAVNNGRPGLSRPAMPSTTRELMIVRSLPVALGIPPSYSASILGGLVAPTRTSQMKTRPLKGGPSSHHRCCPARAVPGKMPRLPTHETSTLARTLVRRLRCRRRHSPGRNLPWPSCHGDTPSQNVAPRT
ncbi:hypothetical protein GQR58_028371 [Nymphon striatum]|nr:hypothetical protein GQR58_028371 [Nymphon striatum]